MNTPEELLADSIARENKLRECVKELNDARDIAHEWYCTKLAASEKEIVEQEQEIADLNKELEFTRKQRDNAVHGGLPGQVIPIYAPLSAWAWWSNLIKRLARK